MRVAACILAATLALGATEVACAQDDPPPDAEARALFEAGQLAFRDGRYEDALEMFTRAHTQSSRSELLYNIGLCNERLGHDAVAAQAYRQFLEANPDAEMRAELERRISLLEASSDDAPPEPEPEPEPEPISEPGAASPAPWIVLGVGAAAAVTGAILLGLSVAASDRVSDADMVDWSTVSGDYDDAITFSGVGIALLAVGGAAMAAGLVWGIVDAGSSTEVAVGPGSVWLRGRL